MHDRPAPSRGGWFCGEIAEHHSRGLFRRRVLPAWHGLQTSRQEFTVKTSGNTTRPRRMTAGDIGRRAGEAGSSVVAFVGVAGVSRYACEAKYPWPRLHGR